MGKVTFMNAGFSSFDEYEELLRELVESRNPRYDISEERLEEILEHAKKIYNDNSKVKKIRKKYNCSIYNLADILSADSEMSVKIQKTFGITDPLGLIALYAKRYAEQMYSLYPTANYWELRIAEVKDYINGIGDIYPRSGYISFLFDYYANTGQGQFGFKALISSEHEVMFVSLPSRIRTVENILNGYNCLGECSLF